MDKIATRAWKKNYGNLSEATKQRLVDTGVHNYKKELIGLNKGTARILEKNNARALFGKNQIMYSRRTLMTNFNKHNNLRDIKDAYIYEKISNPNSKPRSILLDTELIARESIIRYQKEN